MLQPFVVGLGRAGAGLHLPVLAKARAAASELFHPRPVVACDPDPERRRAASGVTTVDSTRAAAELLDPDSTVVHLCTPPQNRAELLAGLAELGFQRFIVEKPLATDVRELDEISALRSRHGLDPAVVTHWLDSELTRRLKSLIRQQRLGELRSIAVDQHKPRFTRSTSADGHPTAFDVEVPHSLAVVLHLAGSAAVRHATWTDMHAPSCLLPRMGSARMALQHHNGVVTEIFSDLTAPMKQRQITLEFDRGQAIGQYPISESDDHAQLLIRGESTSREVFRDDALTNFVVSAYRHFQSATRSDHGTFDLHYDVVGLLAAAKRLCLAAEQVVTSPPKESLHHAC
ncbi:Gfo/Idh/MocA family oxidoreductase [Saccharopolyspora erythraea]|uniref:Gfo/Idh/MocA family protein n=1 Tax=Saccharopolyspora erythraea TaxID=1836 RepID=UPI001BA8FA20|nr:Gfo/Idh/MocA family oxidoreductase [Saccharopolyspora erythraea]QUH04207.1 Gfo/Idh/MocA family oxidoreductase [Saccharopolyspora erythraea]